ncbi:hypothetical protein [Streptomyces justiciae]|uniref:hypothetical protein n=1 Tax=Streptomyces justiciae TaxID=2780140 RepID=UPI00187EE7B2|nr:hypothetical protein [Streptomyces justiciae]MBE8470089.1 hypothetical protein [Streptomyces justiciae]MCW8381897.1 hypothetical protein [Streptomyces justiciae]
MPRFRHFAVPTLAAAALVIGTAGSSFADQIYTADSSNACGAAYFYDYGDTFKIIDICTDGKGVRLQYTNPVDSNPSTSDTKIHVDYTGGYTGYNLSNAYVYDTDMDEDACFYFRVGHVDDGSYVSGSYGSWNEACAAN